MSDLMAKCDWYDGTLSVVLSEDPERIAVRLFDSRYAPARLYVPEAEALKLKTENAKLRELVCWMYDRMDESCAVQHPYAPAPISYNWLMQALARARELGVEVEGWPR